MGPSLRGVKHTESRYEDSQREDIQHPGGLVLLHGSRVRGSGGDRRGLCKSRELVFGNTTITSVTLILAGAARYLGTPHETEIYVVRRETGKE